MSTLIPAKITSQGLLIPADAFRDMGEVEVVREAGRIIVKPRRPASEQGRDAVVRALRENGLLLEGDVAPCGAETNGDRLRQIAEQLGRQRPLSEDVLEERRAGW